MSTSVNNSNTATGKVTPWAVQGAVDYDRIVRQFGAQRIDEALIARIEQRTQQRAHRFLRRGIFFTHRDLDTLLESDVPFYLYTGRGPSSASLHFGHLAPLLFTRYLQDAFKAPLVVQLTDNKKYLFKSDLTLEQTQQYARDNARDLLALGFDPERTFVFTNTNYVRTLYPNVLRISRSVTANRMGATFGFTGSDAVGKWAFPSMQMAPSFPSSFPDVLPQHLRCLIPCAIDQDPYFRLTRDIASRLGFHKPALVHSKFFPALQGTQSKMSSSNAAGRNIAPSTIFLTDTRARMRKVINKHAFSGGGETAEAQRAHGANLKVDVAYQWLRFFMEDDDRLEQIGRDYASGAMLTSEVKAILANLLADFAEQHQRRKEQITDDALDHVMTVRPIGTS